MQWYTGNTLYDTLLLVGFAYSLLVMVSSFFGTAAYGGRFGGGKRAKGIAVPKAGWILMELPGLIVFPSCFSWAPTLTKQCRYFSSQCGCSTTRTERWSHRC